ncbi:MAG: hypothetical protein V3T84_05525 [Phycisphaerales bacterium]
MMETLNLWAAWVGILLGMLSGATQGLFFHRADWLDGYGSWRRRLTRLGHISFFGLAFVNLAFFFTVDHLISARAGALPGAVEVASWLLVAGAVLMPIVCYLSAWRRVWRGLFALPVGCLVLGVTALLVWGVRS